MSLITIWVDDDVIGYVIDAKTVHQVYNDGSSEYLVVSIKGASLCLQFSNANLANAAENIINTAKKGLYGDVDDYIFCVLIDIKYRKKRNNENRN